MTLNFCYVFVKGNKPGERIALVRQGETGYYPCKGYDYAPSPAEQVEAYVRALNARLGVPEDVQESALYASMFGWNAGCADRANLFFDHEEGDKQ